jgi:membrane associated rhomboid family serine protease
MSESPQMAFAFPRPGPALKAVLITLAVTGLLTAAVLAWIPGGQTAIGALTCSTSGVLHWQLWRLVTSGLLMMPGEGAISHLLMTLIGLYFLSPDLERRWGGARFVRFVVVSVVVGNVLAILVDMVAPPGVQLFHPQYMWGAGAAIAATAIAWARENAEMQVRLFFIIPAKGKHLFWFTIAYCVLGVVLKDTFTEGAAAPFGGVVVGLLLGGSPSVVRSLYLQAKLRFIRRQSGSIGMPSVRGATRRPRGAGSPPLRIVQGGLDEDLSKRQPPKDKRYLN